MLFLNNHANPLTDISSIVATKYVILDNLLYTTKITFFPAINSNLVMKLAVRCVYSLSNTSFTISFSISVSI